MSGHPVKPSFAESASVRIIRLSYAGTSPGESDAITELNIFVKVIVGACLSSIGIDGSILKRRHSLASHLSPGRVPW